MQQIIEIKITGHLDVQWSAWFGGLEILHLDSGETLLSGVLPDQAALHSLLERVRDLNLTLVSVRCRPGGEERPTQDNSNEEYS